MKRSKRFRLSYFAIVVHDYDLRTFQGIYRQIKADPIFAHVVTWLKSWKPNSPPTSGACWHWHN